MKRDRFSLILRFIHLNDNRHYKKKGEPGHDPLYKLRPFLTPLIANFQSAYILHREVSVDEMMIGFKGRLGFIQYMPKKPTKWGMKAYVLSDAHTGYIYNWYLYTGKFKLCKYNTYIRYCIIATSGKDDSISTGENGMTHAVVMKLVSPLKDRGHHVYTDNFYTSPCLFSELRESGFGACGTLRINRRGLPPAIKQKIRKGEKKVIKLDRSLIAIKWHDKRVVTILTTIHGGGNSNVQRRSRHAPGGVETVSKPTAIVEYNKYMGGVDTADQLLSYYGFSHRTVRWWRRAFFFLLDMAVVNSYVLYCQDHPEKKGRLTHEQFRVQLATNLLSATVNYTGTPHGQQRQSRQPAARLTERHFVESLGRNSAGRPVQHDCAVCSRKKGRSRKTTTYKCRECNLPMCIIPCFELHHSRQNPQRYL